MRGFSYAAGEPGRKLRRDRDQFAESAWGEFPLQGLERGLRLLRSKPRQRPYRLASGSMRHGELPTRRVAKLDGLFHGGRSRAEPARNREEIDAASGPDQLASLGEARQSLVHRGAAAEV